MNQKLKFDMKRQKTLREKETRGQGWPCIAPLADT